MSLRRLIWRRSELALRLTEDEEDEDSCAKSKVERCGLRLYFLLGEVQATMTSGTRAMKRVFQNRIIIVVSIV